MTRTRWLAIGTALAIVAGACATTAAVITHDESAPHLVAPSRHTSAATASATTIALPPTTTSVSLPAPDAPPTDPYADVPIVQIGTIEIPRIGLLHPIFEGVYLTVVDHGPGHWTGTALPGEPGNTTFAGHRVTHSHPFLNLDQVASGDRVIFHMPNGDFTYVVDHVFTVTPNELWITDPTPDATMTLFACHPKHSAAQRIVAKGHLVA